MSANSTAKAVKSHSTPSASLLSAIANSRICSSVRCSVRTIGTSRKPFSFAAATRALPAAMTLSP